ncbi:hypothetical protein LEP1GSC071_2299 [Leptospira santarosai str. JET]|nr:hypothetical protein LEP1GSC071_2299 [Leptospira santarosai str. JET]EPG81038.1 hypothetical protein LEP1GSC048_2221 [Leptospira santarosai serovar Shermani str. 1342KT]
MDHKTLCLKVVSKSFVPTLNDSMEQTVRINFEISFERYPTVPAKSIYSSNLKQNIRSVLRKFHT